jgi:hypothetical protein
MANLIIFASGSSPQDSRPVENFINKLLFPFFIPSDLNPGLPQIHLDKPIQQSPLHITHTPTLRRSIFIGNSKFYVLFRLLQIMHDRLHHAFNTQSPSDFSTNIEYAGLTPSDRHIIFFKKLYDLLGSTLESSKYEDICRDLFGIEGYVLYTMDKLVVQISKLIRSILEDERCNSFLTEVISCNETSYIGNALEHLGNQRGFRIEFEVNVKLNGEVFFFANLIAHFSC